MTIKILIFQMYDNKNKIYQSFEDMIIKNIIVLSGIIRILL